MNSSIIKYMFRDVSIKIIPQLLYSTKRNHNLKNLLLTMPKERAITQNLQKVRSKLKEKSQKYVPGTVALKVLGSGAKGAPRSLYVFTDQTRYLFNCGEGTQRLAHEHKMRLSKLEQIFVTYPSWDNIGGLPGIALTIQDVGVPEITLHGPAGLDEIFPATKRFVVLKDLSVKMADCSNNNQFQDAVMSVKYVPIYGDVPETNEATWQSPLSESEDEIDYYEHERKRKISGDSNDGPSNVKRSRTVPLKLNVAMSYICKLQDRPGALSLERCVDKRVPAGPLLGQLKAGKDVTLKDGTVVKADEVCLPNEPGPVFLVVECPTLEYMESLINDKAFEKHQAKADKQENVAQLVVHFTPHSVMEDERYRDWMDRFSPSTQHLLLNDSNKCLGSAAVHRIQQKLHLLHHEIFPLLSDNAIPKKHGPPPGSTPWLCETPSNNSIESIGSVDSINLSSPITNSAKTRLLAEIQTQITLSVNEQLERDESKRLHPFADNSQIIDGHTFCNFHLRPLKGLDRADELRLYPQYYAEETLAVPEFPESLLSLSEKLDKLADKPACDYPRVVFLGTGSCIPNKTRNTSGILVHISDSACMLLDCGEGTYGQLVRLYGAKVDQVLRNLRAIYVSHLHADHHIGLIGLLKGRRLAMTGSSAGSDHQIESVFLIAPKQIKYWLNFYDRRFEPLIRDLRLVPNGTLYLDDHKVEPDVESQLLERLHMTDVSTVLVHHCPNAFGVAFTHQDWKISYSGDTMPCDDFVRLGQGSDLLIHEATMEDELEDEARFKLHSTTSQAINIGKRMNAKFTLLTHFSQRYAKLPRLDDNMLNANVGIAFDNMQVSLSQLPILPLLYPCLKLMFANHHDELEQKAVRRNLKREREKMTIATTV